MPQPEAKSDSALIHLEAMLLAVLNMHRVYAPPIICSFKKDCKLVRVKNHYLDHQHDILLDKLFFNLRA